MGGVRMSDTIERVAAATVAKNARRVAIALDALPTNIPTPTHVQIWTHDSEPSIDWLIWGLDDLAAQKDLASEIVKAVGGKWDKRPGEFFSFRTDFYGVQLSVSVDREAVCRRVVTGTREVTKAVPSPDAPMVEVTETIEDVEWVCEPLLAEVTA
jgi:hypothetical protein